MFRKLFSHSPPNPALLRAPSILDLCPPGTHKPLPCFPRDLLMCKSTTRRVQPQARCPILSDSVHQNPTSSCPLPCLPWACSNLAFYQIQCPKVNEMLQRDPRERIVALDLAMDPEMKCKAFPLADSQIHFENILFSPGCGSFALAPDPKARFSFV